MPFKRVAETIDRWIFHAYDGCNESLATYRLFYAIALLVLFLPRWSGVADSPDSFFSPPPSIAWFFSGFPPQRFFDSLAYVSTASAVFLAAGKSTRIASFVLGGTLLLGNTFLYSLGKINHDILVFLVPLVMAPSAWGLLGKPEHRGPDGLNVSWPLAALALIVGLAMLTAAIPKIATGWLDPSAQAVRGHLIAAVYIAELQGPLAEVLLSVDHRLFWEAADVLTVLLEGGFIFAALHPPTMRFFLAVACVFHLAVLMMFDIKFSANLIVYAAFMNWGVVDRWKISLKVNRALGNILERTQAVHILLMSALLVAVFLRYGNPFHRAFWKLTGGHSLHDALILAAGAVGAYYLAAQFLAWGRRLANYLLTD